VAVTDELDPDWSAFYDAVSGRAPRPLLQRAVTLFDEPGTAIDLGCGDGVDTRFLAQRGWTVFAVDATPGTDERVRRGLDPVLADRVTTRDSTFEELDAVPPSNLIHAGYSLPFSSPTEFAHVWSLIRVALQPEGLFVGQLFGVTDSWAANPHVHAIDRGEVLRLLEGLTVVALEETEEDGRSTVGPKHWHVFDIIARQPLAPESTLTSSG
jgi:trans-aconitate methyltransferase